MTFALASLSDISIDMLTEIHVATSVDMLIEISVDILLDKEEGGEGVDLCFFCCCFFVFNIQEIHTDAVPTGRE